MASTRQIIERAFALLFGRFRRLRDLNMSRTDLITDKIIACCVLHNLCLAGEDILNEYVEEGIKFLKKVHRCIDDSNENPSNPYLNVGADNYNDRNKDNIGLSLRNFIAENLPMPVRT